MGNYTQKPDAFYTDLPFIQDVIQLNTSYILFTDVSYTDAILKIHI